MVTVMAEKKMMTVEGLKKLEDELHERKVIIRKEIADKMIKKMIGLRIFEDEEGKTNLSLDAVGGSLLLISQFTLYANCKKGNRPSFIEAGKPDMANEMYEYIIAKCKESVETVEKGSFGADMKVSLTNDGPFTIVLDSDRL